MRISEDDLEWILKNDSKNKDLSDELEDKELLDMIDDVAKALGYKKKKGAKGKGANRKNEP